MASNIFTTTTGRVVVAISSIGGILLICLFLYAMDNILKRRTHRHKSGRLLNIADLNLKNGKQNANTAAPRSDLSLRNLPSPPCGTPIITTEVSIPMEAHLDDNSTAGTLQTNEPMPFSLKPLIKSGKSLQMFHTGRKITVRREIDLKPLTLVDKVWEENDVELHSTADKISLVTMVLLPSCIHSFPILRTRCLIARPVKRVCRALRTRRE
jgi:hypothetical protein